MFLLTPRPHGSLAQIALRNGTIAGEGRADTKRNAMYFACLDAIHNGYTQAALGHATMLSIEDENAVRAAAAASARANPLHLPKFSRLSQTTKNRLGAGAVIAGGIAVLYWLYKPAAVASSVPSGPAPQPGSNPYGPTPGLPT